MKSVYEIPCFKCRPAGIRIQKCGDKGVSEQLDGTAEQDCKTAQYNITEPYTPLTPFYIACPHILGCECGHRIADRGHRNNCQRLNPNSCGVTCHLTAEPRVMTTDCTSRDSHVNNRLLVKSTESPPRVMERSIFPS